MLRVPLIYVRQSVVSYRNMRQIIVRALRLASHRPWMQGRVASARRGRTSCEQEPLRASALLHLSCVSLCVRRQRTTPDFVELYTVATACHTVTVALQRADTEYTVAVYRGSHGIAVLTVRRYTLRSR